MRARSTRPSQPARGMAPSAHPPPSPPRTTRRSTATATAATSSRPRPPRLRHRPSAFRASSRLGRPQGPATWPRASEGGSLGRCPRASAGGPRLLSSASWPRLRLKRRRCRRSWPCCRRRPSSRQDRWPRRPTWTPPAPSRMASSGSSWRFGRAMGRSPISATLRRTMATRHSAGGSSGSTTATCAAAPTSTRRRCAGASAIASY
mmetsp:Transcript_123047/g.355588  ORF Transcript_123047/g.355588 Transcript_123047/m.355588 type:complete len:205 (+) Transcript_123047:208-822(+)